MKYTILFSFIISFSTPSFSCTNILVTKCNDGYVKESSGRVRSKGYPQEWLEKVVEDEPVENACTALDIFRAGL